MGQIAKPGYIADLSRRKFANSTCREIRFGVTFREKKLPQAGAFIVSDCTQHSRFRLNDGVVLKGLVSGEHNQSCSFGAGGKILQHCQCQPSAGRFFRQFSLIFFRIRSEFFVANRYTASLVRIGECFALTVIWLCDKPDDHWREVRGSGNPRAL
jgi:hypothetical protein